MKPVTWTLKLQAAAEDLAFDWTPQDPTREALAKDVRRRAHEMLGLRTGVQLGSIQMDCVQMLRSRLGDPYLDMKAKEAFEEAWAEACEAAQ